LRQVRPEVKFARGLRINATDAEQKLWALLRQPPFANYKFRRQVPLGRYIADFASYPAKLIIEVDGSQHADSAHDRRRDGWFAARQFRVARFWNNDVLSNIEGVGVAILSALDGSAATNREIKR
jgi:very-short-patch-repair endonuclease